jgi:hypothetical protein
MAKLTPNIPYEDLGGSHQIAEYHAAWVMESSKSVSYLALSDFRPGQCGSRVVRQASFGDIEALASGLPMLSQRSYRIGSEQGIVVLVADVIVREASALPNRRYHWVVTLEPLIAVEIVGVSVVPRKVVDRFGVSGFVEVDRGSERFGDRSAVVETGKVPRLLLHRRY